ncbi:hypothetical protein JCM10213_004423 [Rhodosporidiobolus nylandii]
MARTSKRGKRQKKKPFPLLRLPPAVLARIFSFEDVVTLSNLILCRALLPHTLTGLYDTVRLARPSDLARFCASLVMRPELLSAVSFLFVGTGRTGGGAWMRNGSEGALDSLLAKGGAEASVYDPDEVVGSIELLQNLLQRLPLLTYLRVSGVALVVPIFSPSFLISEPFPRLHELTVELASGEDYDPPESIAILRSLLTHLPALRALSLTGSRHQAPLTLLNLPSPSYLPPRSWRLTALRLQLWVAIPAEVRSLFSSMAHGLTHFTATPLDAYAEFMRDLAFLPPSLTHLSLTFGFPCPRHIHKPGLPKFGDAPLFLPSLTFLQLRGDILSPASFPVIRSFPALDYLCLGPHTQPSLSSVLSLFEFADEEEEGYWLSPISSLDIDICACPPGPLRGGGAGKRPNWPPTLGYSEAKELVEELDGYGVFVGGTVLCAIRDCVKDDGHDCPRWYR